MNIIAIAHKRHSDRFCILMKPYEESIEKLCEQMQAENGAFTKVYKVQVLQLKLPLFFVKE